MEKANEKVKSIASWAFIGLCISMPFSLSLGEFFEAVLYVAWIAAIALSKKDRVSRSYITWALLIFSIFRVLSVFTSIDVNHSLKVFEKLPILLVFFPLHSLFERKELKKGLIIFAIATAVASIYGGIRVSLFGLDRARTFYGGYTGLSLQIMISFIIALGLTLSEKSKRWLAILLPALLFGLATTFSRSQWFGTLIGCLTVAILIKPRTLPYIVAAFLLTAIIVPEDIILRAFETFRFGGDSNRFLVWRGGVQLLWKLPFTGYGPYTFGRVFPDGLWELIPDKKIWNYHNDFLQFLLESGIPGFAALIGLWFTVARASIGGLLKKDDLKIISGITMLALFVSSLLNGVITDPMIMPIIAILLAVLGKRSSPQFKKGDKILLVRTDRLGDVIYTTPMARILKSRFTGIQVDILTRPVPGKAAALCPNIDSIKNYTGNLLADISEIRKGNYKAAILVRPELLPALALAFARIPIRLGTGFRAWAPPLLNYRIYRHRSHKRHETQLNLELMTPLGIQIDRPIPPKLEIDNLIRRKSEEILKASGLTDPHYAVFHPGSGGSAMRYPENMLATAAEEIHRSGIKVIITGAPSDSESVAKFLKNAHFEPIDLSGKTDLETLAGVLAGAQVVVASGTGPLHLAAALGTPVVGIFPPSENNGARRWAPLNEKKRILVPDLPSCGHCKGPSCPEHNCLEKIDPSTIAAAAKEFLDV